MTYKLEICDLIQIYLRFIQKGWKPLKRKKERKKEKERQTEQAGGNSISNLFCPNSHPKNE